jgi:alpha-1,3-rhamnosyl/mannosyltransferase
VSCSIVLDARTATDHFPGIGRYVISLARALAQEAPELPPTLLYDPSAPSTRLALPDLPRIVCPASPFSLRQQWAVPRALQRVRATLYHSPYYLMPYRPCVSTVLTVYDLIPLLFPQHSTARARLLFRWATMLALRTAHHVIAISEAACSDLLRYFTIPAHKVTVVPLAAEATFRPQPPEAIAAIRARYGLPEHYALYLGSNKPHKNLPRLVEAWSRLTPHVSRFTLLIAGAWDPRYPEPRQRAEALGLDSIIWLGPIPEADLPALYSGATLFVFPSLYEGFGLPVLEAMACGVPVVCSNTSSLPEVAGEAAQLVDPLDVEAWAEAIRRLWEDENLRRELREKGLAQAARFSWGRTALETLGVYSAVTHL